MSRARSIAIWFVGASAITALGMRSNPGCRLVYNPTTSAPPGWYWVARAGDLKVGQYVLTRLPLEAATLADERGYLPKSVPLLKRIAAVPEQRVCLSGNRVFIDGRLAAVTLAHDRRGRNLDAWRQCRALKTGELFLLSDTNPGSFDSRYFGPIHVRSVIGQAFPLWTW